jgi:hypothetical protein
MKVPAEKLKQVLGIRDVVYQPHSKEASVRDLALDSSGAMRGAA